MSGERSGLNLDGPLTQLQGVGPARARQLAEAGFERVRDLLFHLPARYEDRRSIRPIGEVSAPGQVTMRGRVQRVRPVRVRRRGLSLVRGMVSDDTGTLPVLWFNRPYLTDSLRPDREYLLHGEVRQGRGSGLELLNPSCEPADSALHAARVVPVYTAVGGLGPAALRRLLGRLVGDVRLEQEIGEYLPHTLLERYSLPSVGRALELLHAPDGSASVDDLNAWQSPAHLRLIYGELLELQLELALLRRQEIKRDKPHRYRIDDRTRAAARQALPFKLTAAQRRVLREIVDDLRGPHPMLRLLQGDVGSGKTIVAALALIVAMESGLQGAFMAPTELLAEQHYRTLERLLGERYRLALLTRSAADRRQAAAALAAGKVQLAVGTHALIQEDVSFQRLGLAVVDEQHRFGVAQRREMQSKGRLPDMLVMTATPIPRSLALTVYGDLEISVLDELPPGRRPVTTELVPAAGRKDVYRRLRETVARGEQAYVVFPLIEESERVEAESIEAMGERVRGYLGSVSSAVLHGRMSADERDTTMRAFLAGELRVLIATTVIEVGVDVPNATLMVIESAERFGLAQLHQLRGRVGRGSAASACIAIHDRLGEKARRRLQVFAATTDGFRIAEADLEIRGPGELLGTRQAGIPVFRAANLVRDREWLQRARSDARELLEDLDAPESQPLLERVRPLALSRYERFAGG